MWATSLWVLCQYHELTVDSDIALSLKWRDGAKPKAGDCLPVQVVLRYQKDGAQVTKIETTMLTVNTNREKVEATLNSSVIALKYGTTAANFYR